MIVHLQLLSNLSTAISVKLSSNYLNQVKPVMLFKKPHLQNSERVAEGIITSVY